MPRPDTGNFNRFLASLGLLFLGAALVMPYFYFRNMGVLTISSAELDELTPVGRNAIAGRQDAIASLEIWVIGSAIGVGVIGLFLLVTGALRLRAAQQREDEESDLRQRRARLEFDEMSPAEQEQRDTERAAVEVAEEEKVPVASPTADRSSTAPVGGRVLTAWRRRAADIRRISAAIEMAFRGKEIGPFNSKWQVRIGTSQEELKLDGVFEATDVHYRDVVLGIRATPDPALLSKNARNRADELVATLGRYEKLSGRRASGWIVAVIPNNAENRSEQSGREGIESLRRSLGTWGQATLIQENEIEELPGIFADLFSST